MINSETVVIEARDITSEAIITEIDTRTRIHIEDTTAATDIVKTIADETDMMTITPTDVETIITIARATMTIPTEDNLIQCHNIHSE